MASRIPRAAASTDGAPYPAAAASRPARGARIRARATPHTGDRRSFAALIRMLEPLSVKPDGVELDEEQVKRLIVRRHRHSPEVASVVGSDWAERNS